MRSLTHTVLPEEAGRAVRSVVPRRFQLGEHAYRRLKVMEAILVNGEPARASRILRAGDVIEIRLPSDGAQSVALLPAGSAQPESRILYIDEDMIVVCKGAPLPTLPASHIAGDTLREQLIGMLGVPAEGFCYHPVNRLDKGTSGLMVVARHAHAQRLLSRQLHTGGFIREYLAVTEGLPAAPSGVIDAPIARLGAGAKRAVREDGQRAVTHYRLEQAALGRARIRLRLETGRTHQIRVHLAHIGCPIAGDYLYGSALSDMPGRFALHSAYLSCVQPITGRRIEIENPLPPALSALLGD